jgi:hypothetical protein
MVKEPPIKIGFWGLGQRRRGRNSSEFLRGIEVVGGVGSRPGGGGAAAVSTVGGRWARPVPDDSTMELEATRGGRTP